MKKSSFFLGGAFLLVSLFTTSCKEVLGSLDNPVSSYLTVNVADVTIPTGDTFQLKSETINSDNPITYKSSDETVATVDANGLVTGVADGEATILVSVAASQYYQEGTKEVKVAVKRPLTFEALEDGTIWVNFSNDVTLEKPIYYSVDGGEKVAFTAEVGVPLTKGQKVEFESANDHICAGDWERGLRFWPVMQCAVYGNVMSLISPDGNYHVNKEITVPSALFGLFSGDGGWYPDEYNNWYYAEYPNSNILSHDTYKLELPATTLASTCYGEMFKFCSGLKKAPELPATTLDDWCYESMFSGCSGLKSAPELPATTLAGACYYSMFSDCTNLTAAPALPATELANNCYEWMFQSCVKLETAPALPATKMENYCYQGMFYDCEKLKAAPALESKELAEGCYAYMFTQCEELSGSVELPAEKLELYSYYYMFAYCYKLNNLKCLATTNAYQALKWWLAFAGTDESVATCTFTRSTDNNNWFNTYGYWGYDEAWAVPYEWTITPAIEAASAPAAKPARAASAPIKEVPVLDINKIKKAYPNSVHAHTGTAPQ